MARGDVDMLLMDNCPRSRKMIKSLLFGSDTTICLATTDQIIIFLNAGPHSKSYIMKNDFTTEDDLSDVGTKEDCIFFCLGKRKYIQVTRTERSGIYFDLMTDIRYILRVASASEHVSITMIENTNMIRDVRNDVPKRGKINGRVVNENARNEIITGLSNKIYHMLASVKTSGRVVPLSKTKGKAIVPQAYTHETVIAPYTGQKYVFSMTSLIYRENLTGRSGPVGPFSDVSKLPKYPEFSDGDARMKSFENWMYERVQDPKKLSSFGFFSTEMMDLVRCFFCGLGLKDFTNTDDPLTEHIRYSENCEFLLSSLGTSTINDVKEKLVRTDPEFCRRQQWQDIQNRRNEDIVRCWACDGGLQKLDANDDPWIEHCRWFPACPFALSEKGEEYIKLVQLAVETGDETHVQAAKALSMSKEDNLVNGMRGLAVGCTGVENPEKHHIVGQLKEMGFNVEDIHSALTRLEQNGNIKPEIARVIEEIEVINNKSAAFLKEENKRLKNKLICETCKIANREALFLPCQHLRMCMACSENVFRCPVCKENIIHKLKTYIP